MIQKKVPPYTFQLRGGQLTCGHKEVQRLLPQDLSVPALILAHRGSALPWLVDDRVALRLAESGAYPPDRELPGSPRRRGSAGCMPAVPRQCNT